MTPTAPLVVVVLLTLATVSTASRTQSRSFDLLTASVQDIQDAVAAGALTYERLVQLYLARIAAYDKIGPRLNAVLHANPRALDVARELDAERRRSGIRSPLHGIPIAIKDNVDTKDLPTTGGNVAFAGTMPARDAFIVERLRAAGAIVFLKRTWMNSPWAHRASAPLAARPSTPSTFDAAQVARKEAPPWPWRLGLPRRESRRKPASRFEVRQRTPGSLDSRRLEA